MLAPLSKLLAFPGGYPIRLLPIVLLLPYVASFVKLEPGDRCPHGPLFTGEPGDGWVIPTFPVSQNELDAVQCSPDILAHKGV